MVLRHTTTANSGFCMKGDNDINHPTTDQYRSNYDDIFKFEQKELKYKQVWTTIAMPRYRDEYVQWLEALVGDVRINKEWRDGQTESNKG